jgi:hypothetical protein
VLVGVSGYSRLTVARMIPSREAHDLLGGHLACLQDLGAVPRLGVYDQEPAGGEGARRSSPRSSRPSGEPWGWGRASFALRRPLEGLVTPFIDEPPWHLFALEIAWLAEQQITLGCGEGLYCPDAPLPGAQMASLLVRALELPPSAADHFVNDAGNLHEADITPSPSTRSPWAAGRGSTRTTR